MKTSTSAGPRNRFDAWCCRCRKPVAAGAGRLLGKDEASGRWRVACDDCDGRPESDPRHRYPAHIIAALAVLGLEPPVLSSAIRSKFRELASRYHPDHGGSTKQFIELRAAYEVAVEFVARD